MSRPLAATKAYRLIAGEYNGWLYKDEIWTDHEWRQAEKRRRYERIRKQARRATPAITEEPQ